MVDVVSKEEFEELKEDAIRLTHRIGQVQAEVTLNAATVGSQLSMLASRVDALEQGPQPVQTVPRVISADELKVGQVVAFSEDVFWDHGKVVLKDGEVRFKYWTSGPDALHRDPYFCDTIVLLQEQS